MSLNIKRGALKGALSSALTLNLTLNLALNLAHSPAQGMPRHVKPVEAERPATLVGRWCGLGSCLTLSESGRSLISHRAGRGSDMKELERGLWWVSGGRLCLTAGLESACTPYHYDQEHKTLTLKGALLTRSKAPESAQR